MIMRNSLKNIETKLPQLGINISIGLCLVVLTAFVGQKGGFGATFTTVVVIYLGYKLLS